MRRVLHVNDYPADALGGAEVLMSRTIELLRASGWIVRTFTRADLPDSRLTPLRYIDNRVARRAIRQTLAEYRPDVIHLHNYYHFLSPGILPELARYKQATGARVVMTAHDYHLVCPNSGGNWYWQGPRLTAIDRLGSWWYLVSRRWDYRGPFHGLLKLLQHLWNYRMGRDRRRHIDLVLCTCRFLQAMVARAGLPSTLLPNPNPPVGVHHGGRPTALTLVFAGRVEPEKGLSRFLSVLPADFDGQIVVVGDGSDRAACEAICRARGLVHRVTFLGRRPHLETVGLIAAAHVLLLPSLLFETYPLCIQEAMSVGTNVLVADYGGMREAVLDAGIGFRFDPATISSLAEQLLAIRSAHSAGTLNSFDATPFLAVRTEEAYLAGLERAYAGGGR